MSQYDHYQKYQTLHFDEALQIALSESLHIYHSTKEEEDLALAIQMSLGNEEPDQQKESCCSDSDTCSDPGTVQWNPDDSNQTVGHVGIADETTLIQDCEIKKEIEFSLTVDESSSDDDEEEEKRGKVDNDKPASFEIDVWKEFHEMSITSSKGILAYDTPIHQPDLVMESDNLDNTAIPDIIPGKELATDVNAETTSKCRPNSHKTPVSLADADDGDGHSIWNYTLYDDMVKIPELGTFKRKKHFNGLVTVQLIEKMLSQTSNEPEKALSTTPLSPNSTCRHSLHTHNANLPTTNSQHHRDPHKIGNKPSSRDLHLQTEEERRSRLYNSLVRAQRRYAEKLSTPKGKEFRFTKQEWDSLGEELPVEDWEAGFLESRAPIDLRRNENTSWKGKEKAVEESDEEDAITLMMEI